MILNAVLNPLSYAYYKKNWFKLFAFSDFGLENFRRNEFHSDEDNLEIQQKKTNIYIAPEVDESGYHTIESNVYAFAIILVEIGTRNEPFGVSIFKMHLST